MSALLYASGLLLAITAIALYGLLGAAGQREQALEGHAASHDWNNRGEA